MTDSPTRQIPWLRIFVEGVVIVGSILLAFGLDAWWDGVGDRREEQEILVGLRGEFSWYQESLERRATRNDTLVNDLVLLLEAPTTTDTERDIVELDRALRASMFAGTWDPGSSTRDALISSGRLELIQDDALRAALSMWGSVLDEVRDGEINMRTFVRESIVPHIASRGGPVGRAWAITPGTWPTDVTPARQAKGSYQELFTDPEFRALIEYKLLGQAQTGEEYLTALEAVHEILSLVDTELSG